MEEMITKNVFHYLGKSTDDKASLPDFDKHDVNGTTFVAVDTSEIEIYYDGAWYKWGA